MEQTEKSSSRVDVTVKHSPLAFIYRLFTPTIQINKEKFKRSWGIHSFDLEPGSYEISASYPWLFDSECGKNTINVRLGENESKKVFYTAGLLRGVPGKMVIE